MKTLKDELNDLKRDIANVVSVPGGQELLISYVAQELGDRAKQVRLYNIGDAAEFRKGGLVKSAELVRKGGRGKDEVLLHISPSEFEALVAMWGSPDINPNTGLPEYGFLSDLWDGVKGTVKKIVKSPLFSFLAPVALDFFMPGLGSSLGGALGLSGKAASAVGNTLIRGGAGALSGGKEGALAGAISGLTSSGLGGSLGSKLGLEGEAARYVGDAIIGGGGAELGGGDFMTGALGQIQHSMMQPKLEDAIKGGLGKIFRPEEIGIGAGQAGVGSEGIGFNIPTTAEVPPGDTAGVLGIGSPQVGMADPTSGLLNQGMDWMREHPWLTAGAGALLLGGSGGRQPSGPPELPPEFLEPLPPVDFNRSRTGPTDYYTYGQVGAPQAGEFSFFDRNDIGTVGEGDSLVQQDDFNIPPILHRMAESGGIHGGMARQLIDRSKNGSSEFGNMAPEQILRMLMGNLSPHFADGGHSRGPGSGRDDVIEAQLSDGEYVMDAETVSLLGDGSNDEGARRLDEMRQELRKHKGRTMAKGRFSPDARRPLEYLKKGGSVTRGQVKKIADESMQKHLKTKPPKGHGMRKARGGRIRRRQLVRAMVAEALGEK